MFYINFIKKTTPYFFVLLAFLLSFSACQEVCPDIERPTVNTNNEPIDTTGPPVRHILVEEFTGAGCQNCPQGAQVLESLINTYGTRLIPVSIHTGFFAAPLAESMYDFRIDEGEELDALIGPVSGYPSAAINRKQFPGEDDLILTSTTWSGYIASELNNAPDVDIDITNVYDAGSRELTVTVNTTFVATVTANISLSVLITENNIVDAQINGSTLVPDYTHKHVLRDMLTAAEGQPIIAQTAGGNIEEMFSFTLPTDWNDANCHVVAFVHQSAPGNLEVLQAAEASLIE